MPILDPVFLSSLGRKGNLPLLLLHFPSVPITNNSGNSPKQPFASCVCPWAGVPYHHLPRHQGVPWAAALEACFFCPFSANDLFGFLPSIRIQLGPSACLSSPSLPLQVLLGSPSPPPRAAALVAPGCGLDQCCPVGLSRVMSVFNLHCPVVPLVTCGCWTSEMWPVQPRK